MDTIARMGFVGQQSIPTGTTARCGLSFYTELNRRSLLASLASGDYAGLPTVGIFRDEVSQDVLGALSGLMFVATYDTSPAKKAFQGILPNFGAEVIMFLLALRPKSLLVTNIDLFTTKRYPLGYPQKNVDNGVVTEGIQRETTAVRRSLSWHNPFTHFAFYASLSTFSNVVLSDGLALILAEGSSSYRKKLENLYYSS
jgi:hypothetical protein